MNQYVFLPKRINQPRRTRFIVFPQADQRVISGQRTMIDGGQLATSLAASIQVEVESEVRYLLAPVVTHRSASIDVLRPPRHRAPG